ncbi:MAG: glycosyltransferase family A protein [Cyclobacteriaceae bacterium]
MWYIVIGASLLIGLKVYNFLVGRHFLLDLFEEFRLSRLSLQECDLFCTRNEVKSDIIVSLTTIPSRLPYIQTTLKSLLVQTRRPQLIRLHLPNYSDRERVEYNIPDYLKSLKCLEIIRCEDYGPATKLIPAVEDLAPEQKVLVVDDDMIYPRKMLDHFFEKSTKHQEVAIASSGWLVPDDLVCHFVTLRMNIFQIPPMPFKLTRIKEATPIDILQGYSGYLVKPKFFRLGELKDYEGAPEAARYVDDVWISAHCLVPKVVFPGKRFCFHPRRLKSKFVSTSLAQFNRGGGVAEKRNNTTMIRYFKDRWLGKFD